MANGENGEKVKLFNDWLKYLVGLGLTALLAYSATTNAVNSRLAVIETKQQTDREAITELKTEIRGLTYEIRELSGKIDGLGRNAQ